MSNPFAWMALACLALWVCSGPVRAELYTWTDEQGTVHLSEVPPERQKAKRFTIDKGCTIRKHLPSMSESELNLFIANTFNTPYLRADMQSDAYRNLYDEIHRANAACNEGDRMACECLRGKIETRGMSFAPSDQAESWERR